MIGSQKWREYQLSNEVDWMALAILSNRLVSPCLMMFLCCVLIGLLSSFPAAGDGVKLTNISAPLKDYAELGFALPANVDVETETLSEENYTSGRELMASLLLNGSRVTLHLLYPCQAPQTMLEPAAIKSLLEAYNPALAQANYSSELLSVGGMPAVGGMVQNQIFVAYQPTNQTPALVVMDGDIDEEIFVDFLQYLRITVNEGASLLTPGYCPDTTTAPSQIDTAASGKVTTTPAEARKTTFESNKAKMAADMQAAKEKLAAAKERMRGF
jgi:hypothetical protein